jgi:hypothetical protein
VLSTPELADLRLRHRGAKAGEVGVPPLDVRLGRDETTGRAEPLQKDQWGRVDGTPLPDV